jgi:hypothetical protein
MKKSKHIRVLSISPSTHSVGFAVMEGENKLVAWGNKGVKDGDKNVRSLAKVKELITHYEPGVLVLEDAGAKGSRREKRIRDLSMRIIEAAKRRKLRVATFSRKTLRQGFFAGNQGTKQELAELLAERFPEELGALLPSKRRAWESENHHMPVFDAVAFACHFVQSRKQS